MFKRLVVSIVCLTFSFSNIQYANAQPFSVNQLPVPGTMVGASVPFAPLALKGLIVNPQKPLEFQFIVDTGRGSQDTASVKEEANQLVKYFLAGLTIPESDLWVNLSPYEKNRMVPEALGQTDLGRDLLAQDYILKQLTASLIYPEKDLGKEFWSRVYAKAQQQFGTTNVPVNTFNKVWILPDQAQVFENVNAAYVTRSTLKVMLDEDYLAKQKHQETKASSVSSQVVRSIILPEIEKEVNTGKNFAPLRQIYQALILAKWYKETIQNGLLDAVYTNKDKVAGVNLADPAVKEQIYDRYLKAYKKGAFNYIKEDPTPDGQVVPKKYFSGGLIWAMNVDKTGKQSDIKGPDGAMISLTVGLVAAGAVVTGGYALSRLLKGPPIGLGKYDGEIRGNYRWKKGYLDHTYIPPTSLYYPQVDIYDSQLEAEELNKGLLDEAEAEAKQGRWVKGQWEKISDSAMSTPDQKQKPDAAMFAKTRLYWILNHNIGEELATRLKAFLNGIKDPNTLTQMITILGDSKKKEAVEPIATLLSNGDRGVRLLARTVLEELNITPEQLFMGNVGALSSKSSDAILEAIKALGTLNNQRVASYIERFLDIPLNSDNDYEIYNVTSNILNNLGDSRGDHFYIYHEAVTAPNLNYGYDDWGASGGTINEEPFNVVEPSYWEKVKRSDSAMLNQIPPLTSMESIEISNEMKPDSAMLNTIDLHSIVILGGLGSLYLALKIFNRNMESRFIKRYVARYLPMYASLPRDSRHVQGLDLIRFIYDSPESIFTLEQSQEAYQMFPYAGKRLQVMGIKALLSNFILADADAGDFITLESIKDILNTGFISDQLTIKTLKEVVLVMKKTFSMAMDDSKMALHAAKALAIIRSIDLAMSTPKAQNKPDAAMLFAKTRLNWILNHNSGDQLITKLKTFLNKIKNSYLMAEIIVVLRNSGKKEAVGIIGVAQLLRNKLVREEVRDRLIYRQPKGAEGNLLDNEEKAYKYALEGYDFEVFYTPWQSAGEVIDDTYPYRSHWEEGREESLGIFRGDKLSDQAMLQTSKQTPDAAMLEDSMKIIRSWYLPGDYVRKAVETVANSVNENFKQETINIFFKTANEKFTIMTHVDWDHFYQLEDGRVEMEKRHFNERVSFAKEMLTILIQHSAEIKMTKGLLDYWFKVVRDGDKKAMEQLLDKGIDINANDDGWTALMLASQYGYKDIVEFLLAKKANVNAKNTHGNTALMGASLVGHKDVVELLLAKGADVNVKRNDGGTALRTARSKGHQDIVKILIAHGAKDLAMSHTPTKQTPDAAMRSDLDEALLKASSSGNKEEVARLIAQGADINARNFEGWTALMFASINRHKDIVKLLLAKSANVNAQDYFGRTPLKEAAERGYKDIVELLLAVGGIDVSAIDRNRMTALMDAAENGYKDVVKLLLAKGADVNAVNVAYQTSLMMASREGHKDVVVELLLAKGINVNARGTYGETALMNASNKEVVEALLAAKGIDVDATDNGGQTALSRARTIVHRSGIRKVIKIYQDIVDILIAAGAKDNAMLQTPVHQDKAALAENGGIDLNQIDVLRAGKTVNVQFDPAQLIQLEQGGFEGFTPVIINIQRISNPFQLLGVNPAKELELLAKV